MFAKQVLTDEERAVDAQLGYPRGYAKLCRHAHIQMQGLITPFTEGPPQRFLPYAPQDDDLAKMKEFDGLFPMFDDEERDTPTARKHADFLWQQLDHIGNAGFDPAKFRVDTFGNVVYWNADPASPLAWEVDHWFPNSRGGKTVPSNLRIVQWQANQRKGKRLEFLVPWWDLQVGVSISQFLSVFASKNADFRQRAFSLFFLGGENEQLDDKLVVENHSWPQPFRERKSQAGLAAAALVRVQKDMDETLRFLNANRIAKLGFQSVGSSGTPARRRWTLEEEEALRRAVQRFGPGSWKEIKEFEPMLIQRSTVQIKDKYRLMKEDWQLDKENKEEFSDKRVGAATAIQKEEKLKLLRSGERKQKEQEVLELEEELRRIKKENETEKSVLDELEETLAKQRKRVEKQRRWSETQSQYRLCLEKMIRDTMHQSVVYKEQARLNQAACNALLARLESQKSTCDAAEIDMVKRSKHREGLEALVRPKITKRTRNEGHTDVGSCIKPHAAVSRADQNRRTGKWVSKLPLHRPEEESSDPKCRLNEPCEEVSPISERQSENEIEPVKEKENADQTRFKYKEPESILQRDDSGSIGSGVKRKALELSSDLDVVLLGYEFGEHDDGKIEREESVGDNAEDELLKKEDEEVRAEQPEDEEKQHHHVEEQQMDELLQEVLAMQGKVNAAMADAIEDEEDELERIKRVGKCNLDKWVRMLLLNPVSGDVLNPVKEEEKEGEPGGDGEEPPGDRPDGEAVGDQLAVAGLQRVDEGDEESGKAGLLGGFLRKLSFKQSGTAAVPSSEVAPLLVATEADLQEEERRAATIAGEDTNALAADRTETAQMEAEKVCSGDRIELAKRREEKRGVSSPWRRAASPSSFKRGGGAARGPSPWRKKATASATGDVLESFGRLSLGAGRGQPQEEVSEAQKRMEEERQQIEWEKEFVDRMRTVRESDRRERRQSGGRRVAELEDLMGDARREEAEMQSRAKVDEPQRRRSITQLLVVPPPPTALDPPTLLRSSTTYRSPLHSNALHKTQLSARPHSHHRSKPDMPQRSGSATSSQTLPSSTEDDEVQRRQKERKMLQQHRQRQQQDEEHDRRGRGAGTAPMMGSGGAARKASMLMRSASTRAGGGGARGAEGSPARSSSSGGRRRPGEETPAEVAGLRRKASFFQDWDANEGLRASLSHVWRKAVKKLDLARSSVPPGHPPLVPPQP